MVLSPKSTDGIIRKAAVEDVQSIHRLLNHFGGQGLLLARPLSELYDHVRDFTVLTPQGDGRTLLGVCALGICWEDLAEIRSLAVVEQEQGRGLGSRLVDACLQEASAFGLKRVFTLTYVERFFQRMGFRRVDKSVLPHKVWADCLRCPKYPDCDETAMIVDL
jgi:amino-acid N-acetyltransferase